MSKIERKKPGKVAGARSEIEKRLPLACADERAAVEFMEEQRWNGEPACPKCGVVGECYKMTDATTGERNARFLWRCRACGKQFTVKVGTIMEDSPIPLTAWCYGFWKACSSKKGVSALQIQRQTGLSYKSALFMMHRIRWAMGPANEAESKLTGVVEFDETYVGGRPRRRSMKADGGVRKGPGWDSASARRP
ncbi:MAG: IS1595 family transposase [Gemmatimonadaceae bacterium]|nr:IS1595 family transposase [Gemmatimonadaceae bacterium]